MADLDSSGEFDVRNNCLNVSSVSKSYGDVVALDDVSLSIMQGEAVGLLGPNGAGKTTLLEIICGLRSPDFGAVEAFGRQIKAGDDYQWFRMGIALPSYSLPTRARTSELITLYKAIYDNPTPTDELLSSVGILECKSRFPSKMSNGQKQRLTLVLALIGTPELLILDEPTSELDPHGRRLVWQSIEKFRGEKQGAMLLATHQMDEAQALCDKVGILLRGRLAAFDSPDRLIAQYCPGNSVALRDDPGIYDFRDADYLGVRRDAHHFATPNVASTIADMVNKLSVPSLESLQVLRPTLEDVFFAVTGESLND